MNLTIETYERDGYTLFVASGDRTLTSIGELVANVLRHGGERPRSYAIVDVRNLRGTLSFVERFEISRQMAEQWGHRVTAAIVYLPGLINKFGENTAVNRGARLVVVGTQDEAVAWITDKLLNDTKV
ncbi:MAG: hypothetical protein H6978_16255 [Gammaproteobacteria bacterium]|nr:hypothetical protein [Gammaproteobacteria bacterium]